MIVDTNTDTLGLMDFLSGGNHELFHSNILVYIGKHFPDVFLKLLNLEKDIPEELRNYDPKNLRREHLSFDISITDKNGDFLLVVENKMKSIPLEEQLNQYKEKAENHNNKPKRENKKPGAKNNKENITSEPVKPRFVLLSLIEPEGIPEPWVIVTYKDLIDTLNKILSQKAAPDGESNEALPEIDTSLVEEKEGKYLIPLLYDYIEYIKRLYEIIAPEKMEENIKNGTFKLIKFNVDENEKNKWLHLFKRKLAFEKMKILMKKKLEKKLGEKNIKYVRFGAGITRATPYMEVAVWFDENRKLKEYKPKEMGENDTCFWVQVYAHEIQKGFSIPLEKSRTQGPGKNKSNEFSAESNNEEPELNKDTGEIAEKIEPQSVKRQNIITSMWGVCKNSYPHLKSIGKEVLDEDFCKTCFIPIPKKNKKLRAYIYKDSIMLFVPTDICETTKIEDKIKEISEQVSTVIENNLHTSKQVEDEN